MLAIDLGASSGRGIIGNWNGEKITLQQYHQHPYYIRYFGNNISSSMQKIYLPHRNTYQYFGWFSSPITWNKFLWTHAPWRKTSRCISLRWYYTHHHFCYFLRLYYRTRSPQSHQL